MFAALLGVASFHRACLLAQDFTHEPACQTGERAPQGRFRHQPEQMVHPSFAWQLASFPSLPVCGEEAPFCPLRNFVTLRTYSLEIKAQQALSTFYQCTRNWSGLSAAGYPITGDVFCAASSPGIASDRPWPTLSRATTIRSRHTRIVSAGSSSARPYPAQRRARNTRPQRV